MIKSTLLSRFSIALYFMFSSLLIHSQAFSFFYPPTGSPGNTLTIAGSDFSLISSENIVIVGGIRASVLYSTGTEVAVTVPVGSSTFAPVYLISNGKVMSSLGTASQYFKVISDNPQAPTFGSSSVTAGTSSVGIDAADFNGDGFLDIAVASNGDNSVKILLSNGAGVFLAPVSYAASGAYALTINDFNADGNFDIAVTDYTGNKIHILPGNSNGTFGSSTSINVGLSPASIVAADINKDAKIDLLVANEGDNNVGILIGDGAGIFAAPVNYTVGTSPKSLVFSDINNDFNSDILVVNSGNNTLGVLLSDGVGGFDAMLTYATGSVPVALEIADLDIDGATDVVVLNKSSNNISVFLGDGMGGLNNGVLYDCGNNGSDLSLADIDGDGFLDILVASNSNQVGILFGFVGGAFGSEIPFNSLGAGMIIHGDFNADGKVDMAASNSANGNVNLLINGASGGGGNCALTAAITKVQDVSCANCSDGSAFVLANGGKEPYIYEWNNLQNTASVTNFIAGTYSVLVTDADLCTAMASVIISKPYVPVATPGNALMFNGFDSYADLGDGPELDFGTSNFSLEGWIHTTAPTTQVIIGKSDLSSGFWLGLDNNKAVFTIGGIQAIGTSIVNDGKWHHLAGVRSGGTMYIYVDGKLENSIANSTNILAAGNLEMGIYQGGYPFEGFIDEVRVWTIGRSESQIQQGMKDTVAITSSGLLAYYRLDETDGINFPDISGNGFDGTTINMLGFEWAESLAMVEVIAANATAINATNFNANWLKPTKGVINSYILEVASDSAFTSPIAGSPFTIDAPGLSKAISGLPSGIKHFYRVQAYNLSSNTRTVYSNIVSVKHELINDPSGFGLYFDGINDFAEKTNFTTLPQGSGSRSVELWIKPDAGFINGTVLSYGSASLNNMFSIQIDGNGYPLFSGFNNDLIGNVKVNDGKWHHIALTYTSGQLLLYIDGQLNQTKATSLNTSGTSLRLGQALAPANGSNYKGMIDELRMWNTARTLPQIQNNMYAALEIPSTGLIAYYPANDSAGNTLSDISGGNQNIVLQNMNDNAWKKSAVMTVVELNSISDISTTGFKISWTQPSNGVYDNYLLEIAKDSAFTELITNYNPKVISSAILEDLVTALPISGEYYARVSAIDSKTSTQSAFHYSFPKKVSLLCALDSFHVTLSYQPLCSPGIVNINTSGSQLGVKYGFARIAEDSSLIVIAEEIGTGNALNFSQTVNISGSYIVLANASEECKRVISSAFELTVGKPQITASLIQDASCITCADGKAFAKAIGGKEPYSFAWSNNTTVDTIKDLVYGNYQVQVTDALGCKDSTDIYISYRIPAPGLSLNFDGLNDQVKMDMQNIPIGNSQYTIEAWINPTAANNSVILAWGDAGSDYKYNVLKLVDGTKIVNQTAASDVAINVPNMLNRWNHIAFTYTGSSRSFYLNGSLMNTQPLTSLSVADTNFSIGAFNNASFFRGQMDEVRIWNYALSELDIRDNMYKEIVTVSGLRAYYSFNNVDSSNVLRDYSGFKNSGLLQNMIPTADWKRSYAMISSVLNDPTQITSQGFSISWEKPTLDTSVNAYLLEVSRNMEFTDLVNGYKPLATDKTSAVITGLSSGTTYFVRVSPYISASGGFSAYHFSSPKSVTPACVIEGSSYTLTDASLCSPGTDSIFIKSTSSTLTYRLTNTKDNSIIQSIAGNDTTIVFAFNVAENSNYIVTAIELNNPTCFKQITPVLAVNIKPLSIAASSTRSSCEACNNGTAKVQVKTGTAPYSYSWSNGINESSSSSFLPGDYSIVVTDANNCIDSASVSVKYIMYTPGTALQMQSNDGEKAASLDSELLNFRIGDFTIESWVKINGDERQFIGGMKEEEVFGLRINKGEVLFVINDVRISGKGLINDNHWHHIAGVRSGAQAMLYVDGILQTSTSSTFDIKNSPRFEVRVNGYVDETRLWSVARTAAQIQSFMHDTVATRSSGLKLYYRYDDKAPSVVVADETGNGLNASISGIPAEFAWSPSYAILTPLPSNATNIQNTSFDVTWTQPAFKNLTGFVFELATDKNFTKKVLGYENKYVKSNSLSVSGLKYKTQYYYRVRAIDSLTNDTSAYAFSSPKSLITGCNIEKLNFRLQDTVLCSPGVTLLHIENATDGLLIRLRDPQLVSLNITEGKGKDISFTISSEKQYNLAIDAGNGCLLELSDSIIVPVASPVVEAEILSHATCLFCNDASARVNINGGNAPYQINWTDDKTTAIVTDFQSGNKTVVVTDKYGCIDSSSINILQPPGNAMSFNGCNDYITTPNTLNLKTYTYELMFKADDVAAFSSIVNNFKDVFSPYVTLGYNNRKLFAGIGYSFASSVVMTDTTKLIESNRWYHVAVTYDETTKVFSLYVDGKLKNQQTNVNPVTVDYLRLGAFGAITNPNNCGSYMFKGQVDEFRIWNQALTLSQIQSKMYLKLIGNEAGLVLNYYMDDLDATKAYDVSINQNDGSFNHITRANYKGSYALAVPKPIEPFHIGMNNVTLSWEKPVLGTPQGYIIQLSQDSTFLVGAKTISVNDTTRAYINGLYCDADYFYRIASYFNPSEKIQLQSGYHFSTPNKVRTKPLDESLVDIETIGLDTFLFTEFVYTLDIKTKTDFDSVRWYMNNQEYRGQKVQIKIPESNKVENYTFKVARYICGELRSDTVGIIKAYPNELDEALDSETSDSYAAPQRIYGLGVKGYDFIPVVSTPKPDYTKSLEIKPGFISRNVTGIRLDSITTFMDNKPASVIKNFSSGFGTPIRLKEYKDTLTFKFRYYKNQGVFESKNIVKRSMGTVSWMLADTIKGIWGDSINKQVYNMKHAFNDSTSWASQVKAYPYNKFWGGWVDLARFIAGTYTAKVNNFKDYTPDNGYSVNDNRLAFRLPEPDYTVNPSFVFGWAESNDSMRPFNIKKEFVLWVTPDINIEIPQPLYINRFLTFRHGSHFKNLTYEWRLTGQGLDNTYTVANPVMFFIKEGDYTLSLTITSPQGLSNTQTKTFKVTQDPEFILTKRGQTPNSIILGDKVDMFYGVDVRNVDIETINYGTFGNVPSPLKFKKSKGLNAELEWIPQDTGTYTFFVNSLVKMPDNSNKVTQVESSYKVVRDDVISNFEIIDSAGKKLDSVRVTIRFDKWIVDAQNNFVYQRELFETLNTNAVGRPHKIAGNDSIFNYVLRRGKPIYVTLEKDGWMEDELEVYPQNGKNTLKYVNKFLFLGGLEFKGKSISYNKAIDKYTIRDAIINDVVQIPGITTIERTNWKPGLPPIMKTEGNLEIIKPNSVLSKSGAKEYLIGLGMIIPSSKDYLFDLGSLGGVSMVGAAMTFSTDTVEVVGFGKYPWIIGDYMMLQADKFRAKSVGLIDGTSSDLSDLINAFDVYLNYKDYLAEQKENTAIKKKTAQTKSMAMSSKLRKIYDVYQAVGVPDIEISRIFRDSSGGFWDYSVTGLKFVWKGVGLDNFDMIYRESERSFEIACKIVWNNDASRGEDGVDLYFEQDSSYSDFDAFMNKFNQYQDISQVPVEFVNESGVLVYQSAYGDFIDIDNQIIFDGTRRKIPISGLGANIKIVDGKLNKIIISVDTDIPLGTTPVIISNIRGGIDDLTETDSNGNTVYKTSDFLVQLHCDLTDKAKTDVLKIEHLGLDIRPFTYFKGSGTVKLFGYGIGYGQISYSTNKQLFKIYIEAAGMGDFFKGSAGVAIGGRSNFDITGSGAFNVQVPSYSFIPSFLRGRPIGGVMAGVNTHRVAGMVKIGSAVQVPKLSGPEDDRRFFGWIKKAVSAVVNAVVKTVSVIGGIIVEVASQFLSWLNIQIGVGYDFDKKQFIIGPNIDIPQVTRRATRGDTLYVDYNINIDTRKLIIFAENGGIDSIDIRITDPQGKSGMYEGSVFYFADSKTSVLVYEAPQRGTWTVYYDTVKYRNVVLQAMMLNNNPSGQFISPMGVDTSRTEIAAKFNDVSDTLNVEFYINDNNELFDGRKIANFKVMNNAAVKFNYSDSQLPPGLYYFYFVVTDKSDIPVMQYAPGTLYVPGNSTVPAPDNLKYFVSRDSLTIYWGRMPESVRYISTVLIDNITGEDIPKEILNIDTTLSFAGLKAGRYYTLNAVNINVNNEYSMPISIKNIYISKATANKPPVWNAAPYKTVNLKEGQLTKFHLNVTDPEGDAVSVSLVQQMPKTMIISKDTLLWHPNMGDAGIYNFRVVASDGVNSDTIPLRMIVDPFTREDVSIEFPTNNLFEADNMFVKITDVEAKGNSVDLWMYNISSSDSIKISAQRIDRQTFQANYQLSYLRRSILPVQNGDTIIALYFKDTTFYASMAFFNETPQIEDNIAPNAISDLNLSKVSNELYMLTFTVPEDKLNNETKTDPWIYDLRYNYTALNGEETYLVSQKIESYEVKKSGIKDTIYIKTSDLFDFEKHSTIWFNLKTGDSRFNYSEMSNTVAIDYITPASLVNAEVDSVFNVQVNWTGPIAYVGDTNFVHYKIYRKNNMQPYEFIGFSSINSIVDTLDYFVKDGIISYSVEAIYQTAVTNAAFSDNIEIDRLSNIVITIVSNLPSIPELKVRLTPVITSFESVLASTDTSGYLYLVNMYNTKYKLDIFNDSVLVVTDFIQIAPEQTLFEYEVSIDTSGNIVGIKDQPFTEKEESIYLIDVYPNPAVDYIKVRLNKFSDEITNYQLVSVNGNVILNASNLKRKNVLHIQLKEMVPGKYFLILNSENKRIVKSIIIQK